MMTNSAEDARRSQLGIAICNVAVICAVATSLPTVVVAEEEEAETVDEVIVTADRLGRSVLDMARAVSVVDRERIQQATQQLALDEALAPVPGLYLQNRYNFAQDLRVSLRGFGARSAFGIRGVKVIVDGIPETLPDGQAGVDSIDIGSADRIEVLRGPASALYGNAAGGVIAIQSERGPEQAFVEGRLAAGELGYQRAQLKAGGRAGRWDYMVNLSTQEVDGYRDHALAEGHLINSRIGVQLTERDRLLFSLNVTDQPTSDDPGGINAASVLENRRQARDRNVLFDAGEALDQQRIGIVYDREGDAGTLTLRNYYVWRDFANKLPFTGGGSVDLDRFFYGVGAQYTLGNWIPESLDLTFGIDIERQDDNRQRFDNEEGVLGARVFDQDETVDAEGLYVQAAFNPADYWGVSAGLRYDDVSFDVNDNFLDNGDDSGRLSFDRVSPSLGVHATVGTGRLYASYSQSFETPTTTELANPDASGGFNPSLNPQLADNVEFGWKMAGAQHSFEIAAFRIDIEDELIPFELAAFPGRTFYANAGRSERSGVETAASFNFASGFGIDVSYTLSRFEFEDFVDDNGNDFSGNELPGLPDQFGYLGLRYQTDSGFRLVWDNSFSGELFANSSNSVRVDSYLVSSLRVSREYSVGDWLWTPFFGINNLFDERYNSNVRINAFGGRFFEPAPGRNAYLGFVARFSPPR